MIGWFLIFIFHVPATKSIEGCSTLKGVTIFNLTDTVYFTPPDKHDLSEHELEVTYSWDVSVEAGKSYDGFIYKFIDTDDYSKSNQVKRSVVKPWRDNIPGGNSNGTLHKRGPNTWIRNERGDEGLGHSIQTCAQHRNKTLHVTDLNGTYVDCKIPCSDELGPACIIGPDLCAILTSDHTVLPRNVFNRTFRILYGRHYSFSIFPYAGLRIPSNVGQNTASNIKGVHLFCRHHLIETLRIPKAVAYDYCNSRQRISDIRTSTGPPVNMSIVRIENNFQDHTAKVTIQWMPPYDVVKNKTITSYLLRTGGQGEADQYTISAEQASEDRSSTYYNVTVSKLKYNAQYTFTVTPYVNRENDVCPLGCSGHGEKGELSFEIRDINACANSSNPNEASYCVRTAACQDASSHSPVPAKCTCGPGYMGNGVHEDWDGTGCKNFDACGNGTLSKCTSLATCRDDKPPSLSYACICPEGYFGDGFQNGAGCIRKSTVIISIVVPASFLFICMITWAIWKCRILKRRSLDIKLSKFVSMKSSTYTSPFVNQNGHPVYNFAQRELYDTGPVFGDRWELNRSDLQLQGVIGRGNFGVVHKAILTKDGHQKVVAVKSLTGAYSSVHREEILAEMALLISLGNHDNVLGLIGVCTSQFFPQDEEWSPLLVTEYMPYGDLLHFLWESREESKRQLDPAYNFSELSLFNIGHQVASGLHFLSSSKVIHGDVAARNILVGKDLRCKISDFGLANDVYRYGMIKGATERRVPFKWVSPERMVGGRAPITWRSDVWSFGILLYEMVTLGAAPYPSMRPQEIFQALKTGYRMPRPVSCSDYIYDIMLDCWRWNSLHRPTFLQLKDRLANLLLRHSDPAIACAQRSILPTDDFDMLRYEADIGRRDNELSDSAINADHKFPSTQQASGTPVAPTANNTGDRDQNAGCGATIFQNGSSTLDRQSLSLWTGDIVVRVDSNSEESETKPRT